MGLSTVVAFGLLLTVGFIVGISALDAVDNYNTKVGDATYIQSERLSERVQTSIEILNVTYGNGNYTLQVINTGSIILDQDYVSLVENDTWVPETSFWHNMSSGYWNPEDTLYINYSKASEVNTTFKVIVENGISDAYRYTT